MVSINRILCPVDFSEFSRHALTRATAIARHHGAAVTALHVIPTPRPEFVSGLEMNVAVAPALTRAERDNQLTSLDAFVAGSRSSDVSIDIELVEAPTIAGEILAHADRCDADLILMGTHGRGGFQRLVFGSVTEKVLRKARQPVMTVGLSETDTAEAAFEHIVCAVDFSECSIAALRYAVSLAEGAKAHVTAVNVLEWLPTGYDPLVGPTEIAGFQ